MDGLLKFRSPQRMRIECIYLMRFKEEKDNLASVPFA